MAECNHFSCQECWKSWLARSNTCPTCRKPTHNDNLSRVVFEQAVGAGAPSLTQMYATSDDDVDDELEIVSGA
jgi:predicted amidophosphoribosyltransferase